MIPIRLALRNFMCYHDDVAPLYLDGVHVACLCGDNGNGKSALLDAMTWALWGKARARSDDDLIRLGEAEMEVEFDFAVGQNRYRLLRKRAKGGLRRPGQSVLELQIETHEGFLPITGNTIAETQRKILEILRMDYQTFINSALLLQGRADEFSLKRPGERKEVLASILDLSLYDDLERLARERRKERDIEQRGRSTELARIEHQLEQRQTLEAEMVDTQSAISVIASEVETQESALAALRQSREALRFKQEQRREIDRQVDQANQQLSYLQARIREHLARVERYEKALSDHEEHSARNRARLDELEKLDLDLSGMRERAEALSNRVHHLSSVNSQLRAEMEELKGKIDLLGHGEADCPLCGTELGVEGRERIIASYEEQGREKAEYYRVNLSEIQKKEAELIGLRQELKKLESRVGLERSQCQRRAETLDKDRDEAESSLPQERAALSDAEKAMESLRLALQQNTERRQAMLVEIKALPRLESEFDEADRSYRELRDRERRCRDKLIEVQTGLRRCAELEAEKEGHLRDIRRLVEETSVYEELATAFSKRGIQAMIIDSALPEIEDEANRLLGRMTDNRMHLRIESQRDTKKGDTVETLDIKISDELGTRTYEMFSGGEAFRVNFALRIALSKLLARRAGAPLPTLIIDEGFGTQDSAGREKLVEAINSIQDDFEKILVITHIEELKEAFPVRIEVSKTEDGSTFVLT